MACRQPWPCDTVTLLAALDEVQAQIAEYRAALATVAAHDDFWLVWEADCACELCEGDRRVARLLGRDTSTDGTPLALVAPGWMKEDEAQDWNARRAATTPTP